MKVTNGVFGLVTEGYVFLGGYEVSRPSNEQELLMLGLGSRENAIAAGYLVPKGRRKGVKK